MQLEEALGDHKSMVAQLQEQLDRSNDEVRSYLVRFAGWCCISDGKLGSAAGSASCCSISAAQRHQRACSAGTAPDNPRSTAWNNGARLGHARSARALLLGAKKLHIRQG